jgi:4-amino-4-deoxy-L-arabinose transferase-like glycosyltransferase
MKKNVPANPSDKPTYIAAAALLIVYCAMALFAIFAKSPVFDESVHLTGGYTYWKLNDYRINPENGNFPQRWASLPLLLDDSIKIPIASEPYYWKEAKEWFFSYKFMFKSGKNPDKLFSHARLMILFIGVCLGIAVFFISKEIFGGKGAVLSLALYCFSPRILAHSGLVTSDLAAALFFTLSSYFIWKTFSKITPLNIFLSSFSLALLFLSKMSAPIIIPIYLIMIFFKLRDDNPLIIKIGGEIISINNVSSKFKTLFFVAMINASIIYVSIWAAYGFRFHSVRDGDEAAGIIELQWDDLLKNNDTVEKFIIEADKLKLLPHAYLQGYLYVKKHSEKRFSFLNGEKKIDGFFLFFPYCFLTKTPIPTIIIITMGLFSLYVFRKKIDLKNLIPLIVLCGIYAIFALASRLNIGDRHLLPLFPSLFIICGALGSRALDKAKKTRIFIGFCLLWLAFETSSIVPHFLAYFNPAVGGPENGYKHLLDSSLDWGQDLKELQKIKNATGEKGKKNNFYLSYFGTASINSYGLDDVISLPGYFTQENFRIHRYQPGYYCVSATMLWLLYYPDILSSLAYPPQILEDNTFSELRPEISKLFDTSEKGEPTLRNFIAANGGEKYWIRLYRAYDLIRFAKLCEYLRSKTPDIQAGYSILIYKLNAEEIRNAIGTEKTGAGK